MIALGELKLFLGLPQSSGDVAVTGVASSDIFTATAHGLRSGQPVVLNSLVGGAGLTADSLYWVIVLTANTFQLSTILGGSVVNFTTDLTAGFFNAATDPLLLQIEQQAVRVVEDYQGITYPPAGTIIEFLDGRGSDKLFLHSNPVADPTEVLDRADVGDVGTVITSAQSDGWVRRGSVLERKQTVWQLGHEYQVTYSGGYIYGSEPDNVRAAVTGVATRIYRKRGIEGVAGPGGLKSEDVGEYSYELFDASSVEQGLQIEINNFLDSLHLPRPRRLTFA